MTLSDVYSLDMEELNAIIRAWAKQEEAYYRDRWERIRFLARCVLTPYSKKKIKPTDIIRFEWDTTEKNGKARRATPEDIERIKRRFGIE